MKYCSMVASLLTIISVFAGAQSGLWFQRANIVLTPDRVEASSVYPPDLSSYEVSHLLDRDQSTAWFHETGDAAPSITFHFDRPVLVQALSIINGWTRDEENWQANSRVKDFNIVFSDGSSIENTLLDEKYWQTFQFRETVEPVLKPVTWIRIEPKTPYRAKYAEMGLSEIVVLGRHYNPDDLLFKDLSTARLTILEETTIRGNANAVTMRSKSQEIFRLESDQANRYDHQGRNIEVSIQPAEVSKNDRVIRPGRVFEVTNVVSRPDRDMILTCSDGTKIAMETRTYGSPMGPFGPLSMTEINELFGGILEFSDYKGRQTTDF